MGREERKVSKNNWAGRVAQNQRLQLTPEAFDAAIAAIKMKLEYQMGQKGMGTYASGHEALGILIEEMR